MYARIKEDQSLGELFSDLMNEARTLVRQEIDLAKAEMSRKAKELSKDVAFLAVAGVLAFVGFQAIVAGLVLVLDLVLPTWAAALIVGAVLAVIGYVLARRGLNDIKQRGLVPEQTVETLKEDKEWFQNQMK